MRIRLPVFFICFFHPWLGLLASENPIGSAVSAVTVYGDRALVTRLGSVNLQTGEHVYLFDNLPSNIDPNSIQVQGLAQAELRDVRLQTVNLTEVPDLQMQTLQSELQKAKDRLRLLQDLGNQAKSEKNFINGIATKLTSPDAKEQPLEMDATKWQNMAVFYRKKITSLDTEIRDNDAQQRDLAREIERMEKELRQFGQRSTVKHQVHTVIFSKQAQTARLQLSYLVYGPGWRPVYDVRVGGDGKKLQIQYAAFVRQDTGEDWSNVQLSLSTAQVSVSGVAPELQPWRIEPRPPEPPRLMPLRKLYMQEKSTPKPSVAMEAPTEAESSIAAEPMQAPPVTVESHGSSVLFNVSGRSRIDPDNTEHKVSIAVHELDAALRYETVPKLAPFVYLRAEVTNTTEFPLLGGESHIFYDNQFIAKSQIQFVAPGETFWADLGVDENIQVERKLVKKSQKEQGVFSKSTAWVYHYQIKLKNQRAQEAELVLRDQLPISGHQDIKIDLIEPPYKKDTDQIKKNAFNILEWHLILPARKELIVPLEFSVEYPQDMQVEGLE